MQFLSIVFNLLLWYGFLGVKTNEAETKYIYDFHYKMQILTGLLKKRGATATYVVNPAFWPALLIDADNHQEMLPTI